MLAPNKHPGKNAYKFNKVPRVIIQIFIVDKFHGFLPL